MMPTRTGVLNPNDAVAMERSKAAQAQEQLVHRFHLCFALELPHCLEVVDGLRLLRQCPGLQRADQGPVPWREVLHNANSIWKSGSSA